MPSVTGIPDRRPEFYGILSTTPVAKDDLHASIADTVGRHYESARVIECHEDDENYAVFQVRTYGLIPPRVMGNTSIFARFLDEEYIPALGPQWPQFTYGALLVKTDADERGIGQPPISRFGELLAHDLAAKAYLTDRNWRIALVPIDRHSGALGTAVSIGNYGPPPPRFPPTAPARPAAPPPRSALPRSVSSTPARSAPRATPRAAAAAPARYPVAYDPHSDGTP